MDNATIVVAMVAAAATIYSTTIKLSQRQLNKSLGDSVAALRKISDNLTQLSNVVIGIGEKVDTINDRTEQIRLEIASKT